jgi:predicted  nucleic acid-binding Zn-ribbon protein
MSTYNPNPTPTGPGSNRPSDSQQSFKTGAIVAIVLLSLLTLTFLFLWRSSAKQTDSMAYALDESSMLKAELEKQYYEALSELEELRGSNEELNGLIEQQKEELRAAKDRIEVLLRDGRNLGEARKEMSRLKGQVEQYVAEINQLRQENEELAFRTARLSEENEFLTTNLDSARMTNMELASAKAALTSEKEYIEADRARLSKKVNIASVISVKNLEVEGLKMKGTGKAVSRRAAKNIDQLQVCFTTTANQVAEPGDERFYIRIVNARGETLAVEELGSGIFTNQANGEQIRYTQYKEIDYNQGEQQLCTVWSPSQSFQEGNYTVEVYNKGYLAGSKSFQLK